MSPPNEKRPAGRQPGRASNFKIPRERVYDASNHESSYRIDKRGKWWFGDILIGEVSGRSRKGRNKPPIAVIRLREIERLIAYRLETYGQIPGFEEVQEAAFCFNWLGRGMYSAGLIAWCQIWAPDVIDVETGRLRSVYSRPLAGMLKGRRHVSAKDTCGAVLHLTDDERSVLSIQTMWAEGSTSESMDAARRAKRREYKAKRRRSEGAMTRAEYEARAAEKAAAIKASGMSRRTFYRNRRKDGTSAGVGRDIDIYLVDPDLCHPLNRAKEASK